MTHFMFKSILGFDFWLEIASAGDTPINPNPSEKAGGFSWERREDGLYFWVGQRVSLVVSRTNTDANAKDPNVYAAYSNARSD